MISTLFYPFNETFMQRALIAAVIVGISAPLIGTFVVQRRLSLVGDGLGHVAAAGVGLALWLDFAPQLIAILATIVAACAIEWIFHSSRSSDTALALIFYSGIAASITFAGRSAQQSQLQQYLFGSILSASNVDIWIIAIVCVLVSLAIFVFRRLLLAVAIDESSAIVSGINVHLLHIIVMASVALIVSVSMTITGLLLISAVMVVPVMTARLIANSFLSAWVSAMMFGGVGSVLGLTLSGVIDTAPGGTIVLTHIFIYAIVSSFAKLIQRKSHPVSDHAH